jgi:hypothetical protein
VHAGGQAVVGMVETPGGGDGAKSEEQPPCEANCPCTAARDAEPGQGARPGGLAPPAPGPELGLPDPLGAGLLGGAALAPFFVVVAFRIYLPYRWGCEESGPWQMQVPGLREACISSQPEGHLSLPST